MHIIKIKNIIRKVQFCIRHDHLSNRETHKRQLQKITAADTENKDRDKVAQDDIADDPYCWCYIPDYDKIERGEIDRKVGIEWSDGTVSVVECVLIMDYVPVL